MSDNITDDIQLEYIAKVEGLDRDVKNTNKTLTKLENTVGKVFTKLDEYIEKTSPKPMNFAMIMSAIVSVVLVLGGMFATVIYISNSSNAPLMAQQNQVLNNMTLILKNQTELGSSIQLANKDISVARNRIEHNEETTRYIMYDKELFPTITAIQKDIEYLKKGVK